MDRLYDARGEAELAPAGSIGWCICVPIANCQKGSGLGSELPILFRTVSEALRPQREIVGVLGRFVAAVVSIRS